MKWPGHARGAINGVFEARQSLYAEITTMSTEPQLISMALPKNRQEETKRVVGDAEQFLERGLSHLLAEGKGMFPIGKLNPEDIGGYWTRRRGAPMPLPGTGNPTGGRDSMSIAYQDRYGDWRTLPDVAWKLHGMARFAVVYGDEFHRIEAISRIDGTLRSWNSAVRGA